MANPSLSWNLVEDVHELFAYQFMVNALQAGTIVAVMAGVVGWFVVLRRQSFAAHTTAMMSFPGASGAVRSGAGAAASRQPSEWCRLRGWRSASFS
jgi:zinc/manganese transport system permease protein